MFFVLGVSGFSAVSGAVENSRTVGIQLCTQLYNILVSGMYNVDDLQCSDVMHVAATARILAREVEGT
jgi:hypothetical protein